MRRPYCAARGRPAERVGGAHARHGSVRLCLGRRASCHARDPVQTARSARPSPSMPSAGHAHARRRQSVTRPITAVPGWRSPSSADRALGVGRPATTAQKPQPMLNTSHISAAETSPQLGDQLEHRRHGQRLGDLEADAVAEPQQVEQAAAGDVGQPADLDVGAQQLQDRAHVDHGRLEQRRRRRVAPPSSPGARPAPARRRRAARAGPASGRWSARRTPAGRSAHRRGARAGRR